MRTIFDLSRLARSFLASATVLTAVVGTPQMAAGQSIIQQRHADPRMDFQNYLPQMAVRPWLEARSTKTQQSTPPLPEAGTVGIGC